MKTSNNTRQKGRFAFLWIWSIRYQDQIGYHIRIYMWSAAVMILLLTLSQRISLETSLYVLLIGGLIIGIGLWVVIERRRSWLLGITDPELKEEAYNVMLRYVAQRAYDGTRRKMVSPHRTRKKIVHKKESFTH